MIEFINKYLSNYFSGVLRNHSILAGDHSRSTNNRGNSYDFVNEARKQTGTDPFFIEKYNQHMKNLVEQIHKSSSTAASGNRIPYYYDAFDKNSIKEKLLPHFYSLQESYNDGLYKAFIELDDIKKKLKEKYREQNESDDTTHQELNKEINELNGKNTNSKEKFGNLFQLFYDNVSSSINSDFGVCSDCIESINDKKLKKKYKKILKKFVQTK